MSSDNQYTALGPAAVGFQTDGANIDHGAEISGKSVGVHASCDGGDGVAGQSGSSKNSGVWGHNIGGKYGVSGSSPAGVGVWGSSLQQGDNLVDSGQGVRGDGKIGVHGVSRDSEYGGVLGENSGS